MVMTILGVAFSIFALGILIFIHELGHFIVARINGIRVETFSLGFGKPLYSFKKGGTTYQIAVFPLGGFCKMAGEELKEGVTGAPDEFYSKPPQRRLTVVLAGPVFNYVFGVLLFAILFLFPQQNETYSNRIDVMKKIELNKISHEAPAFIAGMQPGDVIVNIDGKAITSWNDIMSSIFKTFDHEKRITVLRGDQNIDFTIKPILDPNSGMAIIGVSPFMEPRIKNINPGSPAEKAQLLKDDVIVSIDGNKIYSASSVREALIEGKNPTVNVHVRRGLIEKKTIVILKNVKERNLGIDFFPDTVIVKEPAHNPIEALYLGFNKANTSIHQQLIGLRILIQGKLNAKESVGGPVKILYYTTMIAKEGGLVPFITIFALFSVLLGFFNLLPIPAIDGSYVLVFLYEWVSGKKLNMQVMERVQTFGLIILLGLMVLISFNDVMFVVKKVFFKI